MGAGCADAHQRMLLERPHVITANKFSDKINSENEFMKFTTTSLVGFNEGLGEFIEAIQESQDAKTFHRMKHVWQNLFSILSSDILPPKISSSKVAVNNAAMWMLLQAMNYLLVGSYPMGGLFVF